LFVRTQTNGSRTYLLVVDNVRVDGKVKQRVLHRLGRLDELLANGQLDALIQSLSRFSENSPCSVPMLKATALSLTVLESGRR